MARSEYDVIVVGSGAAGCVVAGFLAEYTNATIAVIEAGGDDKDFLIHMPLGYGEILAQDKHVWTYDTVPQHGNVHAYRMGKVLGGGTSINAMCYVRGQKQDYDNWQSAVGATGDWSYSAMLEAFKSQEKNDTFHNDYHGINGHLAVQLPNEINQLNKYCFKAFQEYGLPYNPDYNGESQIGVAPVQSNIGDHKRCSAAVAHLQRYIDSNRVTFLSHHTVTRVLMENKRAIGIEALYQNNRIELYAQHVIISAGAVQTPKILMHSGIGPREQLEKFNIPVVIDSPEVGENLQDHPLMAISAYVKGDLGYQRASQGFGKIKTGLQYILSKSGLAASNGMDSVTHWNPRDLKANPTVQCYQVPIIYKDGLNPAGSRSGITFSYVILQPKSRGWIRLADADPTSMPLINPNFLGDEDDLGLAVDALKALRSVLKQESLASIVEEELSPGENVKTDQEIATWAKSIATTMWHPIGTCRMGQDPQAVVNARLHVNGAERLYVIDASIMPNITSGNTNAPTQALALRAAQMLLEDYFSPQKMY